MRRRLFITLEGVEGAGKSANLVFIRKWLEHAGHKVIVTREPGGTELGECIRDILLHQRGKHISPESEMLLMFAARAEHLSRVIQPGLDTGKTVLCDRFTDATYAYQGGGRGIPPERIEFIENWVQGQLRPDLTFLLDVPITLGRKRAGQRSDPDRFEKENDDFFVRVRRAYLDRAARDSGRIRVIDASRALKEVEDQLSSVLEEVVNARK